MRVRFLPALILLGACASGGADQEPATMPPSDARVAELQTTLTEMLERIDVMNARLARLEAAAESSPAPAPRPAQPRVQPQPAAPAVSSQPRGAATNPVAASAQRAVVGAQIADLYRNAIALYGQNRSADARAAFLQVFNSDPSGELADNALFWIGETYFAAGDFGNAMSYYRRVTDEFGDQNKAPDAMLKLGLAQAKTGDLALARTTLQQVITRYPYSAPASSARTELNRIKY